MAWQRNSENIYGIPKSPQIPSISKMDRSAPSTPASSRIPRNSRRKACRKCVESKAACDLEKPKCKRCKDRGTSCEYPAHVRSQSGTNTENQYATVDASPLSTVSNAISPDSTLAQVLAQNTGNESHTPGHSTIADSEIGRAHV